MINLESLLMLVRMQQLQQLQGIFSPEETQKSLDSNPFSFAEILAGLLGESALFQGSESSLGNLTNSANTNTAPPQTEKAGDTNNLTDLDAIFENFASQYRLQPHLLKSVAKIESNFDPQAISKAGAQGIMQLMPKTAEGLGVKDTFDPIENIEGGAKYLRQLLDRFDNNISLALAAYNAGPGAVNKYGGIPPYKETQNYVKKVMDNMVDLIG
ncbi:MAG: lytic transglycosylase domain-containing protein [Clostridia bacterium]|nr:lytic transglycosylase domain-containing protein [Clostridia bacterium]